MRKENIIIVAIAVTAAICAVTWAILVAPGLTGNGINMPKGVTPQSLEHYNQHMRILWVCIIIGVLVFGAMFTSIVLHRKSRNVKPAQFSHSTTAEILWTVIPIVILVVMAIPATKALVLMEDTSGSEMAIKITGLQWKWKYEYMDEGVAFISTLDAASNAARQLNSGIDPNDVPNYLLDVDKPLVVPVNTKIKFYLTADDVIHAWWVPDLGWKRDAIPGLVNEGWTYIEKPGTYRGQCAELCGKDHGFMPVVVKAVEKDEYQRWLSMQKTAVAQASEEAKRLWTRAELMSRGETVYNAQCATCHQTDGKGLGETFPALAGSGVATGPLSEHIKVVLEGRDGTAMQAWGKLLNEQDIAAALTYTRNAWGNDSGDSVQPSTISKIKNG